MARPASDARVEGTDQLAEALAVDPRQSWVGRTFNALEDPFFRLLYFGNLLQFGSMQMQQLVRGWLVFHLTGSYAALGVVSLANAVPGLIFAPIGGVIADRVPKKTVIQFCQMYNAINATGLALLASGILGYHLEFWHLLASGMVQGGVNSIMQPSRQAIINDLVGPERLMNAIGINASGQTLMQLLGPAVGGLLIGFLSPAAVFATIATLYVLAVTFTARLPRHPLYAFQHGDREDGGRHHRRASGFQMLGDIGAGMKYVWNDPTIRMLIGVNFLIVIVAMPYTMLLPGFVRSVLCVEPGCTDQESGLQQGILQSVQGVGAVAGALLVASSAATTGRGRLMIFWGLLLGIGITAFAISSNFWITLPLMLLIGAGQSGRQATGQVLIQTYAKDEYRGRVSAVWFMQFSLVQVGTFIVGMLAEFVGIQMAIGGLSFVLVIAMLSVAVFVPRMRQLA